MNISVVTLFPQIYQGFLSASLIGRAQSKGLISVDLQNLFDFCNPKQRVDSPTFGHGHGMLLRPELVEEAIEHADKVKGRSFKIFFSPQGKKLDQVLLKEIYAKAKEAGHLLLMAPRYEGVDTRVEDYYADEVISIGDYVLMGGDVPAMVFLEAFSRFIPEVVGNQESVVCDSFTSYMVDYPEYTAPVEWKGMRVPDIVRSGDHKALSIWRKQQALDKTVKKHFSWIRSFDLSLTDRVEAAASIPSHYVVLMHDDILLKNGEVGTSSVTSIDIHDIARSSATYGIKGFYVVTPLADQQAVVSTLMNFWHSSEGAQYNQHRYKAMASVVLKSSLDDVINDISQREGEQPLLLATCAKVRDHEKKITYNDQSIVWQQQKPVLFMLGTSHGLSPAVIDRAHYLLLPIYGFSSFNHLSVRSAAAIIFDRWLGVHVKDRSRLA
jgi:tRNA (guanine37-N1)-methyltransferase